MIGEKENLSAVRFSFKSDRHRLVYVATPKAACTSLKWWFANLVGVGQAALSDEESIESAVDLKIHDVLPRLSPGSCLPSDEALLHFINTPGAFSFGLVRNPFSRLFSAWQSKLLLREPLQYGPYRECEFARMVVRTRQDLSLAFELFLEHLHEKEAPVFWDVHWMGQWRHLRPDILPYSLVSQVEDPSELCRRLAAHLGNNFVNPFSSGLMNESLIPYSRSYLTDRAKHLIRELYGEDIERFGYPSEPPSGQEPLDDKRLTLALKAVSMIRSRHLRLSETRAQLGGIIQALTERVKDKEKGMDVLLTAQSNHESMRKEKELEVANFRAAALHWKTVLAGQTEQLEKSEILVKERDILIQQLHIADAAWQKRNGVLTQKIEELEVLLDRQNRELRTLEIAVTERQDTLVRKAGQIKESEECIAQLQRSNAGLEEKLRGLEVLSVEFRKSQECNAELERANAELEEKLKTTEAFSATIQAELDRLNRSKLTLKLKRTALWGMMCVVRGVVSLPFVSIEGAYGFCQTMYRVLPLPSQMKRRLGNRILSMNTGLMDAKLRWQTSQLSQCVPDPELDCFDYATRNMRSKAADDKRRILIVEKRLPTPDRTSSSVRMDAILHALRELDWEIDFVSHSGREDYHWVLENVERDLPRYEHDLAERGIHFIYGMQAALLFLQTEGREFRYAFLSCPEIAHCYAPLVRAYMPNAKLIYDTVDLHGLRFRREAAVKGMDPELLKTAEHYERIENSCLRIADRVVAITEEEKTAILSMAPAATIEIIPNIHRIRQDAATPSGRRGLVFIGHYLHAPNVDAVEYFVREVLPIIRARIGDIDFHMLGSSITDKVKALSSDHVHAIGYVENPEAWFEQARVFVAPLRFGAGMKGKIGHSLACGLPVVTTSVGAEGMGLESGTHVLIADQAKVFAEGVISLYQDDDLWKRVSDAGVAHIQACFSAGIARAALERLTPVCHGRSGA